jgi:hypothetical protein
LLSKEEVDPLWLREEFKHKVTKEDHPAVIEEGVAQHLKDTGVAIACEQIPAKTYAPSKGIRRKRKQTESDDEEEEEEKPKKKAKKTKASKSVASDIEKEVAELESAQVLKKRTRGGSSEDASPPKKKIKNQPKKPSRKHVLSTYTEEEDIEEDSSSLIKRTKKAEAVNKFMEISSGLQSEVVSEFTKKDMGVEDPKEVVVRKQAEDRVQMKKLSKDLQGKDVVDSSSLVLTDSDALMTKVSEDVIPTSFHQTCVNFNDLEITITFENPDHLSSASVNDSEAMENVIT